MSQILFLTNVDRRYGMLSQSCDRLHEEHRLQSDTACYLIKDDPLWSEEWISRMENAHIVILKWMGRTIQTPFLRKCRRFLESRHIPYYIDADGSDEKEALYRVDRDVVDRIRSYVICSGRKNFDNMILYIASVFLREHVTAEDPSPLPWTGIYHPLLPQTYTDDGASYRARFVDPAKPTVGIFFYREEWIWEDLFYQNALIEEIGRQGMNVICVFSNGMPVEESGMPPLRKVFRDFFTDGGKPVIDVLINAFKFSFTSSGSVTIPEMKKFSIPVLQGYSLIASLQEWKDSIVGLSDIEVSISVSIPEFDGVIHSGPIATKKVCDDGSIFHLPIEERLAQVVRKAKKWALLRHIPNEEKKIAVLFHNYPPKNSNIGSAFGMDSIESVRRLMGWMRDRGYRVGSIPKNTEVFIKELTANATNDIELMTDEQAAKAMHLSREEYLSFAAAFDDKPAAQMKKDWGDAPGNVMIDDDGSIIVPGTLYDNLFVSVQPARGYGLDPAKVYHDPYVAPTHQYEAFYKWIRDVWKADAVIHVGTHGNLEWLPGRSTGLGRDDFPDISIDDLPNIYPYHMTITGEGIQAKRRSCAALVDYLPAPLTDAGLYDETAELEKVLEDYADLAGNEQQQQILEESIRERAQKADLDGEVPYDETKPFSEYTAALHSYLEMLKDSEVHMGLHILGQPPLHEELTEFTLQLLRLSNGDMPSLLDLFAEKYGTDSAEIQKRAGERCEASGMTYAKTMTHIRNQCRELVLTLQDRDFSAEGQSVALSLPAVTEGTPSWQEKVKSLVAYICDTVYPALMQTSLEKANVLDALEGRYVEPGPAGSPTAGGVGLLPTGRNFYGLDPRSIPTAAAWDVGIVLADQLVERFIAEEGHYPESVGMVFWAGANYRTRGQDIAEYLYLMGIRPVWQPGSLHVIDLEVIPLSELKRPRIDVTARISGLFRDTMPIVSKLIDKAVLLAASLDESDEDNYVRRHISEDAREMEEQGIPKEEAWRNAAYRVFGDPQGVYGAGVNHALDDKNWQTVDDLAAIYVRWGGHVFGGDAYGKYMPDLYKKRLSQTEVTVKNQDNHETNILNTDDYNDYQGGMIATIRSLTGKAPRAYTGDTTDAGRPVTRSVQEEVKRIFRTESVNPKYIKGLMKHGYKGASDMYKMLNQTYQWDATSDYVDDWMYEKYAEKYAFDPEVQEWMKRVNPWALKAIVEKLLEADQRELWHAKEETRSKLQQLYLDAEGDIEGGDDE